MNDFSFFEGHPKNKRKRPLSNQRALWNFELDYSLEMRFRMKAEKAKVNPISTQEEATKAA